MKNSRYLVTTYTRAGDMFVPRQEVVALPTDAPRRAGAITMALMVMLATPVLVHESATLAYFADTEASNANTLAAGPLDIEVIVDKTAETLFGDTPKTFTFTATSVAGSLPLRYKAKALASGDPTFCSALMANAAAPLNYVGTADSLNTPDTNTFGAWLVDLEFSPVGVVDGAQCQLDFTFDAYQVGGAVGTEYHDAEQLSLLLTASVPQQLQIQSFEFAPLVLGAETAGEPEDLPIDVPADPPADPPLDTSLDEVSGDPPPEGLAAEPPALEEPVVEEPVVEETPPPTCADGEHFEGDACVPDAPPAVIDPPAETPPTETPAE